MSQHESHKNVEGLQVADLSVSLEAPLLDGVPQSDHNFSEVLVTSLGGVCPFALVGGLALYVGQALGQLSYMPFIGRSDALFDRCICLGLVLIEHHDLGLNVIRLNLHTPKYLVRIDELELQRATNRRLEM